MGRVLVACECSNTVRDVFLKRGHDAYSCDYQMADFPNENYKRHIRGDVSKLLLQHWDLVIAHPPCTYLTKVFCANWIKGVSAKDQPSAEKTRKGIDFFKLCLSANAHYICVENTLWHNYAEELLGIPHTQLIQPWQFGHPYSKATRLWLENLPPLQPTEIVKPKMPWVNHKSSHSRNENGKSNDSRERSKTFQGIAEAMAEQWGKLI